MYGLRPRIPLSARYQAWAVVQHLLMPNDWPANLLHAIGRAPALAVISAAARSAAPLGSASELRIAFAADFHAGPTTHAHQLDRAFEAIETSGADLILLGGDFVGHRPRDVVRLAPGLRRLRARAGVFAVLGNHDNNTDPVLVSEVLGDCGVRLLVNESVTLPEPFASTRLVGLDDHGTGAPDASAVPRDPGLASILLVHQPSGVLDARGLRLDLALAGHTHGGQIALPNGFSPVTPSGALSRTYLAGEYALPEGGTLFVSRGVGASTVPMRWNCPADLLLVSLHGPDAVGS